MKKRNRALWTHRRNERRRNLAVEPLEDRRLLAADLSPIPKLTGLPSTFSLVGSAHWEPNEIVLTDGKSETGSVIIANHGRAVTDFRMDMAIHLTGGNGGQGLSFGYGPLSGASFGQHGQRSSGGLWLLVDTYDVSNDPSGVELWYNNQMLKRIFMSVSTIRGKWQSLRLDVSGDGRAEFIYEHDSGSTGWQAVTIPNWSPQSHWRYGVGASTLSTRWDEQRLEDLWLVDRTAPPSISLGGSSGNIFDNETPRFTWSASDANSDLSSVTAEVKRGSTVVASASGVSGTIDSISFPRLKNEGLGTYTLTVNAADRSGYSTSSTRSYNLLDDDNIAPQVLLGGPTGTISHGQLADTPFTWDAFDTSGIASTSVSITRDGQVVASESTASGSFSFQNQGPGAYTFSVSATDADNDRTSDGTTSPLATLTVLATNDAPVAVAGLNQTAHEGESVRFDGTGSSDPDGDSLSYSWNFGDGSTGSGSMPSHVYADEGTYRAVLTVDDGYGLRSSSGFDVTVLNRLPRIESVSNSGPVGAGEAVTVTVNALDAAGDTLTYEFDFNNDGIYDLSNTTGTVQNSYLAQNVYPVNVRVTDGDGGTATAWTVVQVGPELAEKPLVSFSWSSQIVGESVGTVGLSAELSEPAGADVLVPLQFSGEASPFVDYEMPFTYLLFPAGTTTALAELSVVDDSSDEDDERLIVSLAAPINASLGEQDSHVIMIGDDDLPPRVTLTRLSQTVDEGAGQVLVSARVDIVSGKPIEVPLSISGTADIPADYTFPEGTTLVIPPGSPFGILPIAIVDDTEAETNETIILRATNLVNAVIANLPGTTDTQVITVPENDAPSVSFTTAYRGVEESASQLNLTVRLSRPYFEAIDVPVSYFGSALPSDDYETANSSVHFDAGQSEATVSLTIIDDNVAEPRETIVALLGTPTHGRLGTTRRAVIDIAENDRPFVTFGGPRNIYYEDAGHITIPVYLTNPSTEEVLVPIRVQGGTAGSNDYDFFDALVAISPGEQSGVATLRLNNDSVNEGTETINLGFGGITGGRPRGTTTLAMEILDDDPLVQFTRRSTTINETDPALTVWANLSAPTNKPVTVPLRFVGDADRDSDYTVSATQIVIPAGSSGASITLAPVADNKDELQETVRIELDKPTNAQLGDVSKSWIYLMDNTVPEVSFGAACSTVVFPEQTLPSTTFKIGVELSTTSLEDVTVPVRLKGIGATGSISVSTVTIPAGKRTASFAFTALANGDRTPGEVRLALGDPGNVELGSTTKHAVQFQYSEIFSYLPGQLQIDPFVDVNAGVDEQSVECGQLHEAGTIPSSGNNDNDSSVAFQVVLIILRTLHGYVDGGTAFFDANGNGVLDFLDLNLDGIQDPNEPDEVWTTTGADGGFQMIVPAEFDRNGNGTIDPEEGQFVVAGGVDTSTQLPLANPLVAPPGVFVVSPLSTLMAALVSEHGMTTEAAQQRVVEALGLPGVDLRRFDALAGTVGGVVGAPEVFTEAAKLQDMVTQLASLVHNLENAPPSQNVAQSVMADLAAKIVEPGAMLDLSNPYVVESVLEGVLERAGLTLDATLVTKAAQVAADGNAYLDSLQPSNSIEFLEQVAQAQVIAEGPVAAQLGLVAGGTVSIDEVVAAYMGASLVTQIQQAQVGNLLPVSVSVSDATILEGGAGQSLLEFTVSLDRAPALPVHVDYATADLQAVSGADYLAVDSAGSAPLFWNAGDMTPRTIRVPILGDTEFEGDEVFYLRLSNPVNAILGDRMGRGLIVDDDPFEYVVPDDGLANDLQVRIDGRNVGLTRNGVEVFDAYLTHPSPITIRGGENVADSLTAYFIQSTGDSVADIRFVAGGDAGNALKIRGNSEEVAHIRDATGSGQLHFGDGGMVVSYTGVDSLAEQLTPQLLNAPYSGVEGSSISASAIGTDAERTFDFQWTVVKDAEPYAAGNGDAFQFTPDDNGSYLLTLTSTADGRPSASTSHVIQIDNLPPRFEAGDGALLLPPQGGVFSRSGITFTDPGADAWSGTVNYQDGTGDIPLIVDQAHQTFDLSHTFLVSGIFDVLVTLDDDEGGTHTDTFQLEVILNTPPVARDDAISTDEASSVTLSVLADNGSGADRDSEDNIVPASTVNLTSPSRGILTNHQDGRFTFDPNGDFEFLGADDSASESFTYRIIDAFGENDTATVTITVAGRNDSPEVVSTQSSVTVSEGALASNGGTFHDVDLTDNVVITASIGSITQQAGPSGNWNWSFNTSDGPDQSQQVTITATDKYGMSSSKTFQLVVNNVGPAFDAASKTASFDLVENSANDTVVGTVSAGDPGNDTLTYRITGGTGASIFTIDETTGRITVVDAGPLDYEAITGLALQVSVTDDEGATDAALVIINLLNQPSITGTVFVDTDQNGLYDANEMGLDFVDLELLDEDGNVVATTQTSAGGFYLFEDLNPGPYLVRELQPSGVADGQEQLGSLGGFVVSNDMMQLMLERTDAHDYIFAELGQQLTSGDTAGIGFWQNKHGQQLISLAGFTLGSWLTSNFTNVFGNHLDGADGAAVARFYREQLFMQRGKKVAGPAKVDAQFMAVALAVFFTNRNLAGDVATDFGFRVTDTGIATRVVNVGSRGAAFATQDNADRTIMQLLQATSALTDAPDNMGGFAYIYDRNGDGMIDSEEEQLRKKANELYSLINESGGL